MKLRRADLVKVLDPDYKTSLVLMEKLKVKRQADLFEKLLMELAPKLGLKYVSNLSWKG